MNLKALFAAAVTAIALVSCGSSTGGGVKADKASTTRSIAKVQKAFDTLNFFSAPLRQQAGTTDDYPCDTGEMSITTSSTDTSGSFSLTSSGCTEGDVNFTSVNFNMAYTVEVSETSFNITLTMNGSISYSSSEGSDTLAFNNFTMKIAADQTGTNFVIKLNGSVTVDGDTVVFNNDTYNSSDFN